MEERSLCESANSSSGHRIFCGKPSIHGRRHGEMGRSALQREATEEIKPRSAVDSDDDQPWSSLPIRVRLWLVYRQLPWSSLGPTQWRDTRLFIGHLQIRR